jgi:hypothetical protein
VRDGFASNDVGAFVALMAGQARQPEQARVEMQKKTLQVIVGGIASQPHAGSPAGLASFQVLLHQRGLAEAGCGADQDQTAEAASTITSTRRERTR